MFKRFFCFVMCIFLFVASFASCSNKNGVEEEIKNDAGNAIVGKWYAKNGKCFDVRRNNTYRLEGDYGTGSWRVLDDGTIEFIDFYGAVDTVSIEKDEKGREFFKFFEGTFYRDEFPVDKKPNEDNLNNSDNKNDSDNIGNDSNNIEITESKQTETEKIEIDPFENLEFTVSGISPYCTVAIDTSSCSEDAQRYVEYALDKEFYANGDKVVVSAKIAYAYYRDKYVLSSEEYNEYTVLNQPEYLTSIDGVKLDTLESELADYVAAGSAKVMADDMKLFSMIHHEKDESTGFTKVNSITLKRTYFSSLKTLRQSDFYLGGECFNKISFIYAIEYSWENVNLDTKGDNIAWFNISAENMVLYPDGHIDWGTEYIGKEDFTCEHSIHGEEACVSATVTLNATNYNISKIN